MSTAPASVRPRAALLVGLAYAAFVSLGLPDGLTGVAWPSIRATFDLPLDALGAWVTAGTVGYLASSFCSGRILARIGVGWLLVLSCLATAISLLGYGGAPAWTVIVGLGLLAGLGAGAIDGGLNTYAAETFTARTMNWLHAAFGLGAASGPLLMSSVLSAGQSWRFGYLIVGVAQILLATCFVFSRNRWRAPMADGQSTPTARAPMIQTLRLPSAWLSMLLFFLCVGLEACAGQWLYTVLTEARAMRSGPAGVWVSVFWGSLTAGRLLSGGVVARISVQRLLRLCMAGAVFGAVLLWPNREPWLAFGGVSLLGLSLAPMFPSFIALTPARMGPAHTANTVGFQVAAAMLGGAVLVSGYGRVADKFGLETFGPFLLAAAIALTGVFAVLQRHARQPTAQP